MQDNRSLAFAFVVDVLKDDPELAQRNIVWLTPDAPDFTEPLPTGRYGVRLVPQPGRSERQAVGVAGKGYAKAMLHIQIHTRIPGYSFRDSMDLFGEIEAALMPFNGARPAFDALARANGIADIVTVQPACSADPTEDGVGQIDLVVHVPA